MSTPCPQKHHPRSASPASASPHHGPSPRPAKPQPPLSGYDLFDRYKRHKACEATAPATHEEGAGQTTIVRAILAVLPGTEDVPPAHPLWRLPPRAINEFRASNIRRVIMEGALLFPHARVQRTGGAGFVEMGRAMRSAWWSADAFTKKVFFDLAEVGRIQYRSSMAEYKEGAAEGWPSPVEGRGRKRARTAAVPRSQKVIAAPPAIALVAPQPSAKSHASLAAFMAAGRAQAAARATANDDSVSYSSAGSNDDSVSYSRAGSNDDSVSYSSAGSNASAETLPPASKRSVPENFLNRPTRNTAMSTGMRRVSQCLGTLPPANTLPAPTNFVVQNTAMPAGMRRVSQCDLGPVGAAMTAHTAALSQATAVTTRGNTPTADGHTPQQTLEQLQQFLAQQAFEERIQRYQNTISDSLQQARQNAGLPLPPVFPPAPPRCDADQEAHTLSASLRQAMQEAGLPPQQGHDSDQKAGPPATPTEEGEVSTADFMEFIGWVDEAIDVEIEDATPIDYRITQKADQFVARKQTAVPMPAYALNNNRARTA